MKTILGAALLVCLFASAAAADECDVMASDIVRATGIPLQKKYREALQFDIGSSAFISIRCPQTRYFAYLSISWIEGYPPQQFFDLLGVVAKVALAGDERKIARASVRCYRESLRPKESYETTKVGRLEIICDKTSMTVQRPAR